MNKVIAHFKKVCIHKYYVGKYCFMAGIPIRGIMHDLSKFSPVEFFESVKYYQGNRSPIDKCKEVNGYSKAWMHHKGRNKHHYEYWQDNFENGGKPIQMPFKDSVEMVCDFLGAGHAYWGVNFNFKNEQKWWIDKKKHPLAMHPQTILFLDKVFKELNSYNPPEVILNKKNLKRLYKLSEIDTCRME